MKISRSRLTTIALTLSLALFFGCGAPVQGRYKIASFTKDGVLASQMAVVGVQNAISPLPAGQISLYSNILMGQIQDKWDKLQLTPAQVVAAAMGEEEYNQLMFNYGKSGNVSQGGLKELKAAQPNIRYAVFSRIESDSINHNIQNTNNPPPEHFDQKKNKWITSGDGSYVSSYETVRTISLSFSIYDLELSQLAWSGTITESVPRSNNYTTPYSTNQSGWENIANGVLSSMAQGQRSYPSPATVQAVLQTGFYDFAHKMLDK